MVWDLLPPVQFMEAFCHQSAHILRRDNDACIVPATQGNKDNIVYYIVGNHISEILPGEGDSGDMQPNTRTSDRPAPNLY